MNKAMETSASIKAERGRYKTLLDEVTDAIVESDLEGKCIFMNKTALDLWGGKLEDVIGKIPLHAFDKETARRIKKEFAKILETGNPALVTFDVTKRDGTRATIEDSVSLVRNAEGEATGWRTISRDITARKKAENEMAAQRARLEAIFRSVKDAIITVAPDMKVIQANHAAEAICGISLHAAAGKTFSQCFNQCSQSCGDVLKQTIQKKETIKDYRIECNHQQHFQQVISVTSSPLLDPEGKFAGAVLAIHDMTLMRELERELRERHQFQKMIGKSKRMQEIYTLLEDLASLETTVLITGESGTGKELVAKALHYSGQRAFHPFVSVNCSALAENLLESELFGHVRGAFTGAVKDKQGRFQAADGGTLLLDEIGDISPLIQLKLLRVLQEKVFERVGESRPQKVDVRVIAATNKALKEKVRQGEFREDLYYRLKVVEIPLPSLRERLDDLPLLVDHFRNTFNERFGKQIEGISNDVLTKLMAYPWPGNIRELEHVIEHAFILCHGPVITREHLPRDISARDITEDIKPHHEHKAQKTGAQDIQAALTKAGGNKAKAARILGMSRRSLYRRIADYQLTTEMTP